MNTDILSEYESKIWATADLLRGQGIKESEWPAYMMPFFALVMIESRLLRLYEKEAAEFGGADKFDALPYEDRYALLMDSQQGYNKYLFEQKKTLREICLNDKSFDIDFNAYLEGFDDETRYLLGVDAGEEGERFLNIRQYIGILKAKKVLMGYVKQWSEIDLRPFDNSAITTLEEHIKRKWADMSAETAGEQYTPDDVIALIAEIIVSKLAEKDTLLKIYDPASGGGNLLFGVEDRIKEKSNRLTQTFGQEINDALYALAKIESRFREDAKIEHGNTLTEDKFYNEEFDVSVANPPFGVDWKGYQADIRKDKTGRFKYLPSVSDGQLLFTQHLIAKMAHDGIAVIVHNGSTLFSGDAGSAESNLRKWMLDTDIVEALIQLPTDEFFNTGIYTYLWVLNKNKAPERKDRVMLIDASGMSKPLKKSKGAKRKEVDEASRLEIVEALRRFEDCCVLPTAKPALAERRGGDGGINPCLSSWKSASADSSISPEGFQALRQGFSPPEAGQRDASPHFFARVFDKEYFYYNKQAILLTNVDENGKYLPKAEKLDMVRLENGGRTLAEFPLTTFDREKFKSLADYYEQDIKPFIAALDYREGSLAVSTANAHYWFDTERQTLVKEVKGKQIDLGCGQIVVKAAYKKANKKQAEQIEITIELTPDTERDYEIVPFHRDAQANQAEIATFMAKYVTRPFQYQDNIIGVEINFNKVFYQPEQLRSVDEILGEIEKIDNDLRALEDRLSL